MFKFNSKIMGSFTRNIDNALSAIPPKEGSFRIVQFSDLHLGLFPEHIHELCNKRLLGAFNHLLRRRSRIEAGYIAKLASLLPKLQADAVICTGDLTSVSLPKEFVLAEQALEPITSQAKENFLYVPGNHDAYVADNDARLALENTFSRLNNNRFSLDELPLKLDFPGMRMILLNPAHPSGWLFSYGTFSQEAAAKTNQLLAEPAPENRVIISHFPALDANGKAPGLRHGLRGSSSLAALLQQDKAAALLSGHVHTPYSFTLPNGCAQLCCGSLTLHGSYIVADFKDGKLASFKIVAI